MAHRADSAVGKFTSKAIDFVKETVDSVKKVWNDFGKENPVAKDLMEYNGSVVWEDKENIIDKIEGKPVHNEESRHKRDGSLKNNISGKDIKAVEKKTFYFWWQKKF